MAEEKTSKTSDVEEIKDLVGEEISAVKSPANNRRNLVLKSSLMKTDDNPQSQTPDAAAKAPEATGVESPTPEASASESTETVVEVEETSTETIPEITDIQIGSKVLEFSALVEEAGAANDDESRVERVAKCFVQLAELAPHAARVAKTEGAVRAASAAALGAAAEAASGFSGEKGELVQKSVLRLRDAVTDADPNAAALKEAEADRAKMQAIQKSFLTLDALDSTDSAPAGATSVIGGVQSSQPADTDAATLAKIQKWLTPSAKA